MALRFAQIPVDREEAHGVFSSPAEENCRVNNAHNGPGLDRARSFCLRPPPPAAESHRFLPSRGRGSNADSYSMAASGEISAKRSMVKEERSSFTLKVVRAKHTDHSGAGQEVAISARLALGRTMPPSRGGRDPVEEPVLTILRRLLSNIAVLLRLRVLLSGREARALAKEIARTAVLSGREVRSLAREIARSAVFIGVAALISFFVVGLLLAAAVLALSLVMKPWAAALVVFGATALVMILLFFIGASRLRARIRRLGAGIQIIKEDLRRLWAELFRG